MKRARNALARVGQKGSPAEKRLVYAAVKRKYPALAKRSSVIPGGSRTPARRGRRRGGRRRARS